MYLRLTCKITIGNKFVLRGVNSIEVKRSIHQLIQTATVKLPLSIVMRNNELLQRIKLVDKIKEGDTIKLEFGYNGNNRLEFEGYIRRINYTMPLEVECEDELYLLRKVYYKNSFKKVTLKELLQFVLQQLEQQYNTGIELYSNLPELVFSNFIMNQASGIDILQELKDKYSLTCYLTTTGGKKTLYCGLAYTIEKGRVKYVLSRNTINTNDLKYEGSGNKKYQVKITNFNRNGTKTELKIGDKNGEQRSLNFYGDHDMEHLRTMAKAEMERFSNDGYHGSFETFLIPFCEPGMISNLADPQFEQRAGNYYISTVVTTFNNNGGRRKPEVGIKLST